MDKSKARLILRFLLVALFGLIILSIGIAFVADKLLPEALADWVHQENSGDYGVADIIGLLFWGPGCSCSSSAWSACSAISAGRRG